MNQTHVIEGFVSGLVKQFTARPDTVSSELSRLESIRHRTLSLVAGMTEPWQFVVLFGVMGGATQPQGHVQILLNIIDFDMNIQEAGDAPRILHSGSSEPTGEQMTSGGTVALESGFSEAVQQQLEAEHQQVRREIEQLRQSMNALAAREQGWLRRIAAIVELARQQTRKQASGG